jgi:hypothetical protein
LVADTCCLYWNEHSFALYEMQTLFCGCRLAVEQFVIQWHCDKGQITFHISNCEVWENNTMDNWLQNGQQWSKYLRETLNIQYLWYDPNGFEIFVLCQMSQPQENNNSLKVVTKCWFTKSRFIPQYWTSYINGKVWLNTSVWIFSLINMINYFGIMITFSLK